MKNFTKLLACISFLLYSPIFAQLQTPEKADDPLGRSEDEADMIKDPKSGIVPIDELVKAHIEVKRLFKDKPKTAITGITWYERGPNNIGGRTRALMMDPNDLTNKRVWAGGVAGGLWYNNDITSSTTSWTKINDFWDNLAISCIAYNPASTTTFYVGTGEGFGNSDATFGGGIWKTIDGGTTWNVLTATIPSFITTPTTQQYAFQNVQKIVVNGAGKVFAATQHGVWESIDDGTTWTSSFVVDATLGNSQNFCSDLEYVGGVLYAGFGRGTGTSIRMSIDDGASWTTITPPSVTGGRTELAVGNAGTIYAVSDNNFYTISYFKKSTDDGATWTNVAIPTAANLTVDVTSGQAWYDLILAVHPTDDNVLFIGGASHARTVNGGTSWFCFPYSNSVHPDHHNIIFRTGNTNEMIMANDGGVYYSTNYGDATIAATTSAFSFSTRNKDYNVMQPFAVAMKNVNNDGYILQGNQDNGTTYMTAAYNTSGAGSQAGGGDGMLCLIDQNEPNILIGSFQFRAHYTINPTTNVAYAYLAPNTDLNLDGFTDGQFVNPCDYDHTNNIFYANVKHRNATGATYPFARTVVTAYNSTVYNLVNVTAATSDMNISFVKASPYTAHTIFFGSRNGELYKVTGMNTVSPTATLLTTKTGYVSCIEIGASDNELILTLSSYNVTSVWYSNDGGTTWVDKDALGHGLPNIPVRYALFNPLNRKQVLLATELGVWSTTDITASNPDWQPTNANLANVRCEMLRYRSADNTVAVATHGRGIFTTKLPVCPTDVVKTGNMSGTETVVSGTYINGKTANVIQTGANTTYSAKTYVLLEPKFETQSGAIFKALIGGCN